MKDEIKEILNRLDYNEWEVDLYKVPIQWSELYDIRDYITNLQEEIHKKEAMYDSLAVDYRLSQEENEKLKEENIKLYKKDIKIINEIKEKIDDYFVYDYKNESQARLDTINEINHIIVDLYNGGDEE